MRTEILQITERLVMKYALNLMRAGEVVAFPTDTVYGLGALVFEPKAVENIYKVKMRPVEKAIPVMVSAKENILEVAAHTNPMIDRLAEAFLPGALTLVVPKRENVPSIVSADDTVAVRIPAYEPLRELMRRSGALAVTSANISGQPSPTTPEEVFEQLKGRVPLILDGGKTSGGIASTIVDCTGDAPRILREGPISLAQIENALK